MALNATGVLYTSSMRRRFVFRGNAPGNAAKFQAWLSETYNPLDLALELGRAPTEEEALAFFQAKVSMTRNANGTITFCNPHPDRCALGAEKRRRMLAFSNVLGATVSPTLPPGVRIPEVRVNRKTGVLYCADQSMPCDKKKLDFRVFALVVRSRGRRCDYQTIRDELWDGIVEPHTIKVQVYSFRDRLKERGEPFVRLAKCYHALKDGVHLDLANFHSP